MYQFNENDGISITLTRKRMKNIRIRVTGEKRVCVSAPHFVTAARIDAFVQEHEAFIRKQLEEVERKRSAYYPLHLRTAMPSPALAQGFASRSVFRSAMLQH